MKVWELREALEGVDPDAIVVNAQGLNVCADGYALKKDGPNAGAYPAFVLAVDADRGDTDIERLSTVECVLDDVASDISHIRSLMREVSREVRSKRRSVA